MGHYLGKLLRDQRFNDAGVDTNSRDRLGDGAELFRVRRLKDRLRSLGALPGWQALELANSAIGSTGVAELRGRIPLRANGVHRCVVGRFGGFTVLGGELLGAVDGCHASFTGSEVRELLLQALG